MHVASLNQCLKQTTFQLVPLFFSLRATCSHPRIPGRGYPVQVVRAGSVNRSRDGVCGALYQTHFRKSHGLPVRLHQHAERPAAAAGSGPDGAFGGVRGATFRTCTKSPLQPARLLLQSGPVTRGWPHSRSDMIDLQCNVSFSCFGRFEQQIDVKFPIMIFFLFCCLHLS